MQPSLLDTAPRTDGPDITPKDNARLAKQRTAIQDVMQSGQWYSLAELAGRTGYPEASISARIRDFRKLKFGGHTVERQRLRDGSGTWMYRLVTR